MTKLLEENIEKLLQDFVMAKDYFCLKLLAMKIDKWTFIKLRLSCTIKETIKKVER
jgi:hypothetical protein